ncbi:hypothetical protein HPP92_001806 [Vanilla planifolia]|uniref:Uncharacterized protein n=1 Tax=Vanilla planifolia TaxID=51239 RepID=A0A835S581_VANPL|nr:hypothetical protein HPP92_001806 [Vanilla planifolia]
MMTATLLLGNLAAVVTAKASAELRRPESMVVRTSKHFLTSHLASGGDGSHPPQRKLRRRANGKQGPAVVYSFNPSSPSGDRGSEEDWEQELRNMLMDIEEMEVLKNRAEELQSRSTGDEEENGGGGKNESEEEKRERVRRELEMLAKDLAERRETGKIMFELGQKAYGKGKYLNAVEFLEAALTIIPRPTLFGGEIQIWLCDGL